MNVLHFPVGTEIETGQRRELPNALLPRDWSQVQDGSCGQEFKSGVMTYADQIFTEIPAMCQTLIRSNYAASAKSGVHVHIGFKQIGDLSAKYRLFRFVSVYEQLFFSLMPPRASRAHYCTKLSQPIWQSFQRGEGFNYWKDGEHSRYWWFNGAAMHRHGTVEFRHMNGTLDADEIIGWISVLQCMFKAAVTDFVKLDWNDHGRATIENLLTDLRVETNEPFGERAKSFILACADRESVLC